MNTTQFIVAASLVTAFVTTGVKANDKAKEVVDEKLISYPLETCAVSGEGLGEMGGAITYEVKFCCKGCLKKFIKNPKKYVDKVEKARVKSKENASNQKRGSERRKDTKQKGKDAKPAHDEHDHKGHDHH